MFFHKLPMDIKCSPSTAILSETQDTSFSISILLIFYVIYILIFAC